MCGICNLFRSGRNSGCCRDSYTRENCCNSRWNEPRMRSTCASGYGSNSTRVCGYDETNNGYTRSGCGCQRDYDCD